MRPSSSCAAVAAGREPLWRPPGGAPGTVMLPEAPPPAPAGGPFCSTRVARTHVLVTMGGGKVLYDTL